MNEQLKYYLQKSTQILIPNQLCFGTVFALLFRNLLIIIIFALCSAGINELQNSFFFPVKNSFSVGYFI